MGNMKSMKKNNNFSFDPVRLKTNHLALHYKSVTLEKHINENILSIRPSNTPEDISSRILNNIWETMDPSIQKDVIELYEVYNIQQWTATSLIAVRLLERVLSIHIVCDLKEENINGLGDAIQKLKKHNYDTGKLDQYREKRNNFMHGEARASSKDAKELVNYVMQIALHIHNIKPEEV